MLFILNNWKLIAIGAAALAIVLIGFNIYNKGYNHGELEANKNATEQTDKTIKELSNDADNARRGRIDCLASGGVWSFADNKCTKG